MVKKQESETIEELDMSDASSYNSLPVVEIIDCEEQSKSDAEVIISEKKTNSVLTKVKQPCNELRKKKMVVESGGVTNSEKIETIHPLLYQDHLR